RLNIKDAEAPQFDTVTLLERLFHGFEDRFDRHFGFGLGDAGPVDDFVDDVQLDQNILQVQPRSAIYARIGQPYDRIEFIPMSRDRSGLTSAHSRRAAGRFATGIPVPPFVAPGGPPHGLTFTSFTSVILAPPLVLVCIAHAAVTVESFRTAKYFGV